MREGRKLIKLFTRAIFTSFINNDQKDRSINITIIINERGIIGKL